MIKRNSILALGIIIGFAMLIFSISLYFNYQYNLHEKGHLTTEMINQMSKEQIAEYMNNRESDRPFFYSFYLLPFAAFIGVIVGTIVYYVLSDKITKQEKSIKNNTKVLLSFFTSHERNIINKLLENNGKASQIEFSYLPNMNKVKTHRIINTLENKGIIFKEKVGKINRIVLKKEIFDVLK